MCVMTDAKHRLIVTNLIQARFSIQSFQARDESRVLSCVRRVGRCLHNEEENSSPKNTFHESPYRFGIALLLADCGATDVEFCPSWVNNASGAHCVKMPPMEATNRY
jgi:hypothetical protein